MVFSPQIIPIPIPPVMLNPAGFGNMLHRNVWNHTNQILKEISRITEQINENCLQPETSGCSASASTSSASASASTSGPSAVSSINGDTFEVKIDVHQFNPEEINVKLVNSNTLIVTGKHEERSDGDSFVSRSFSRRYIIPDNYDIEKLESQLALGGVLTIKAPRKPIEGADGEKIIPITLTSNLSSGSSVVKPQSASSTATEQTVKDGCNQPIVEKPEGTQK